MLYYHSIFGDKVGMLQGSSTYAMDFERVVLPVLQQLDTGGMDIDWSIAPGESRKHRIPGHKHVSEWHYNYDFQETIRADWPIGVDGVIVHTREAETYFNNWGIPNLKAYFIPMSIDVNVLPPPPVTRLNRWIYLGNLNNQPKRDEEAKLKQAFLNKVDVLSYGQFNGDVPIRTHEQCMEIASQYTYGAAVGRSIMELLAMGVKCMVVGRKYGGPIRNDADLLAHLEHNINSWYYSSSTGNLANDYAQLVAGGTINRSLIDMNQRISDYVAVFNDILTR